MKRIIWSIIVVVVGVIIYFLYLQYGGNTDVITVVTATSGLVTEKKSEPYSITLAIRGEDELEYIDILVKNENTWNLVKKNQFYLITLYDDGIGIPELGQINNDDYFGEIFETEYHDLMQKVQMNLQ